MNYVLIHAHYLIIHCISSYISLNRYAFWVTNLYKALLKRLSNEIILAFFHGQRNRINVIKTFPLARVAKKQLVRHLTCPWLNKDVQTTKKVKLRPKKECFC